MAEMTQVEWRNHIARQKAKRKQQIEDAKAAPEVKEAEAPEVTEESVEPTTDAKVEDAPVEVVEEVVEEAATVAISAGQAPEVLAIKPEVSPERAELDRISKVINNNSSYGSYGAVPNKEDLGKRLEAAAKENGFFPNKLVTEAVAAKLATENEPRSTQPSEEQIMNNLKTMDDKKPDYNFIFDRMGDKEKTYKSIYNPSLLKFEQEAFDNHNLLQELDIDCLYIRKTKYQGLGLWEEGGARGLQGSLLMITDAQGNEKEFVIAYRNRAVCNGRHALIPINENDHILIGARRGDEYVLALMRLHDFNLKSPITDGGTAKATCIAMSSNMDGKDDDISVFTHAITDAEKAWCITENSELNETVERLFELGEQSLFTQDICKPIFVKNYCHYFINQIDYDDIDNDAKFEATMQTFRADTKDDGKSALANMYDKIEEVFDEQIPKYRGNRDVDLICTIAIKLTKSTQTNEDILVAYTRVYAYNLKTNSSRGGRIFYGAAKIKPDDVFYYPGMPDKKYSYEAMLEYVKRNNPIRSDGTYKSKVSGLRRLK